jgi:hypothetical protein
VVGEETSFQDRMEEGSSQYGVSCLKNCESIMQENGEEREEEREGKVDVWVEVPNIIEV